ncbi:fluoride efflux transporter CrcB [Streptomyces beigongshangae]|uniref:fluoride efflux transporter CrcB n=1 Tax=Streptomyces beigongshangae TaxID=2841597 RepID=UPI001C85F56D|nr:fluoride efflux transporter CrcB [Streptomyces sp. REN17]
MTSPGSETADDRGEPRPSARRAPVRRAPVWRGQGPVVAVVAVGGAAGASARYGAALLWPARAGGFPWTTFWVNVAGCFAIGVLMVLVTEVWTVHRLVRPLLGTGVLGGFTTFSTYAVDIQRLTQDGLPRTALAYLAATLLAALAAVRLAVALTRACAGPGGTGTGAVADRSGGPS